MSLRQRWDAAARLVSDSRDVLDARPGDGEAPEALVSRGWARFLLGISEEQLAAIEIHGLEGRWPEDTPASLLALIEEARAVCTIPSIASPERPVRPRPARRLETPRKRAQIDAFADLILPLSVDSIRVVDVGSGHGHLTREISERISLPVVGLERDVTLTDRARTLPSKASPSFALTDVLRDGLPLSDGDCVVGLHACGELGDAMVEGVTRCKASLALVGCCLQKRRAPSRRPLAASSDHGADGGALDLPSRLLGLSNLTPRNDGVEATRTENLAARERRLALHRLLVVDGGPLRLGAEMDGLNRRAAQDDLSSLVARAFARRRRPTPSANAIDEASEWARTQHARGRRLSLPRAMLARALEVFVLLDRALYLEEHDLVVTIGALFPAALSARNLALVAKPRTSP